MEAKTGLRVVCIAVTLAVSAAAAADAPSLRTIALSSVETPDGFENPEPVHTLFDSLIAGELTRAGFSVVPPSEVGPIWKRLVDSVQGFYSALTGELVEEKYRAVVTGTLRELGGRLHADAWLRPRLDVTLVDFEGGKARWDGADEGMGSGTTGSVPALSLAVSVLGMDSKELYRGRGGIQVLRRGGGDRVPRDKLFRDQKRNLKALHLALDSLLTRRPGP